MRIATDRSRPATRRAHIHQLVHVLFNSLVFILAFLPGTLAIFFAIARRSHSNAAVFLVLASVFFYGWWDVRYVPLLLASVAFNYVAGRELSLSASGVRARPRWLLGASIAANLALLAVFKYADFFVDNLNAVADARLPLLHIVLPLGISFFTFTQIAFLVDAARGEAREYSFVHYALFVTYFPHLIAGPILHHREMMPQFAEHATYRFSTLNVAVGLTIFFIGLFKKSFLADSIAPYASPVFAAADAGTTLSFFEAWQGALAYTLQLYFDFSGYSDMAIGVSRMFGVKLPLNFASPYKAENIVEFWRCWHMTLSRFLREYVYIPLGGNRLGGARRHVNVMVTMLLGGLWHGAGWTFVVWGALHGGYLVVNHLWHGVRDARPHVRQTVAGLRPLAVLFTFACVVVAWVFFRATTLAGAVHVLGGMSGHHGFAMPASWQEDMPAGIVSALTALQGQFTATAIQTDAWGPVWIAMLLAIVWLMPNTQEAMRRFAPALETSAVVLSRRASRLEWRPTVGWALVVSVLAILALASGNPISEFLYFQF